MHRWQKNAEVCYFLTCVLRAGKQATRRGSRPARAASGQSQAMTLVLDLASLPDSLFAILQGYASLTSIRLLPDISNASFFDVHDFLLNWLLLNPHFQVYPPSEHYQVSFWKWAVGKLEKLLANQVRMLSVTHPNHAFNSCRMPRSTTACTLI